MSHIARARELLFTAHVASMNGKIAAETSDERKSAIIQAGLTGLLLDLAMLHVTNAAIDLQFSVEYCKNWYEKNHAALTPLAVTALASVREAAILSDMQVYEEENVTPEHKKFIVDQLFTVEFSFARTVAKKFFAGN